MSRREAVLREAEEAARRKADRTPPYDKGAMDCSKMPLGCWMWLFVIGAALFFGLGKLIEHAAR